MACLYDEGAGNHRWVLEKGGGGGESVIISENNTFNKAQVIFVVCEVNVAALSTD